jgi:RNA polymerase sigma-70 factor, ECF subfamily
MRPPKTARASNLFKHSWPVRQRPRPLSSNDKSRDDTNRSLFELPPAPPPREDPGNRPRYGQTDRVFDAAYLDGLRDRDPEIETDLVNSLSRPVWVKVHQRLRSPQLTEDARQETFLRVFAYFRSGKTLDNPATLPGFVIGICNNVCHELLRSHTRHDQMPLHELDPHDTGASPEQRVVTEERKQVVTTVLNHLSTKDRQVLKRLFLDEADKDDVCHELGIDRAYLRLVVHRAKGRFKAALQAVRFAAGE